VCSACFGVATLPACDLHSPQCESSRLPRRLPTTAARSTRSAPGSSTSRSASTCSSWRQQRQGMADLLGLAHAAVQMCAGSTSVWSRFALAWQETWQLLCDTQHTRPCKQHIEAACQGSPLVEHCHFDVHTSSQGLVVRAEQLFGSVCLVGGSLDGRRTTAEQTPCGFAQHVSVGY
jgi:hypothetical protein